MFYPLQAEPVLEILGSISLDKREETVVADCLDVIQTSDNLTNGPAFISHAEFVTDTSIAVWEASYVHVMGLCLDEANPYLNIGASIVVQTEDGYVFSQRAEHVVRPGSWELSASGGMDTPVSFADLAQQEVESELGITQLEDLQCVGLVVGQTSIGVIFHGYSTVDQITINPNEVAQIRILHDPSPLQPQLASLQHWSDIVAVLPR